MFLLKTYHLQNKVLQPCPQKVCPPNIEYRDLSNEVDEGKVKTPVTKTAFSEEDETYIHPPNDDSMAITLMCDVWKIIGVLADQ